MVDGELHWKALGSQNRFRYGTAPGFVHVPINFRLSRREVGDILRHCGARAFIVHREFFSSAHRIAASVAVIASRRDKEMLK